MAVPNMHSELAPIWSPLDGATTTLTRALGLLGARESAAAGMLADSSQNLTQLLRLWGNGDASAGERCAEMVYDELRRMAKRHMRGQPRDHTLQASALVNEAYLKLFRGVPHGFRDRSHFLAVASHAMRSLLVDHARGKARRKRRAEGDRLPLDSLVDAFEERSSDLDALDDALERLAERDERMVRVVELRFFLGATASETADILGCSQRTVERDWNAARLWLRKELE